MLGGLFFVLCCIVFLSYNLNAIRLALPGCFSSHTFAAQGCIDCIQSTVMRAVYIVITWYGGGPALRASINHVIPVLHWLVSSGIAVLPYYAHFSSSLLEIIGV